MGYLVLTFNLFLISVSAGALTESSYCRGVLNVNLVNGWNPRLCRLNLYRLPDVTECLDSMLRSLDHKTLHFAFVGDSRIRFLFNNFAQFFPDYDFHRTGFVDKSKFHEDAAISSEVLNSRISFWWRPLLNDALSDLFHLWSTPPFTNTPTFILFGVSFWHMLRLSAPDPQDFQRNLTNLVPQIHLLTRNSVLVWINQHPLAHSDYGDFLQEVSLEKIDLYNSISRRILRDSGAIFWDSSDQTAEEYVRSCDLNYRQDRTAYLNCDDNLHVGNSAIFRANLLLMNFLCNRFSTVHEDSSVHSCCNTNVL